MARTMNSNTALANTWPSSSKYQITNGVIMRVLQELLAIHEENQVMARPMELAKFVHGSEGLEDAFPKLLKKKWNTPGEIVWHGLPLFHREEGQDWNEDGEAFDKIYEDIREYVEDGYELNYNITIH